MGFVVSKLTLQNFFVSIRGVSHSEFSERFIPSEREPYTHRKIQNTRSKSSKALITTEEPYASRILRSVRSTRNPRAAHREGCPF